MWFTAITPGQPVTTSTRNAFATITVALTVEDWLKAQVDYESAEARLQEALDSERKAEAAYYAVAPWGGISTFFADEAEKRRIEPVKACRDAAERARATAFVARQTAHRQVAAHCEQILRDVSSPEQLQRICGEPDIAQLLVPIIQQTGESASTLWGAHSRKHGPTSALMAAAISDLQVYYSAASATSIAVLSSEGSR